MGGYDENQLDYKKNKRVNNLYSVAILGAKP